MSIKSILIATAMLAAAAVGSAVSANADPLRVSGPAVHENLSVYFVHGDRAGGAVPLTLDQALANGSVKIHETDRRPLQIENVSNQSVFIQLGDLIRGGLQDQVVGTTMLLPPHSGMTDLLTFCVDPFRSAARDGEDAKLFSATGAMFPWRMAELSILSGTSEAAAVVSGLRESAIWWSVDSLRTQLAQKLGEPLESPKASHWNEVPSRADAILAARHSAWKTSLPLALENRHLVRAQQSFADAFRRAGAGGSDVIGAVFAIDGQVVGADLYQSHALFRQMWPKLLRAYAAESLASDATASSTAPSRADVSAFLMAAAAGQLRRQAAGSAAIRDGAAALYAETADSKGQWVHRGYVPKLASDATSVQPEALLVRILETGQAGGRALASFDSLDTFPVRHTSDGWAVEIPPSWSPLTHAVAGGNDSGIVWLIGWFVIVVVLLRPTVMLGRALGVRLVRMAAWLVAALAEGGRVVARSGHQAAAFAALAAANTMASLRPARLVMPFNLVRPAVAARRGYARSVPAFAVALALALAIVPRAAGLW